jgi:hypothetical protein
MSAFQVAVHGTLKPDGTLELSEAPQLPPGPVDVLIRAQSTPIEGAESWWEYLQCGRAELLAQGQTMRGKEAIDADLARRRSEDENRRRKLRTATEWYRC